MEKTYWLLLGIVSLYLSYLLLTLQQYFSAAAAVGIFALAIISSIILLVPFASERTGKDWRAFLLMAIAAVLLIIYELVFDRVPSATFGFAMYALMLISAAALVSVLGICLLGRLAARIRNKALFCLCVIAGIALITLAAFMIMYFRGHERWGGDDVLAFDYYGGYLLLHGQNPYAADMNYILNQYNVPKTLLLNGTYVHAYDYPAFGFLQFILVPLLGIRTFFAFIPIMIFLTLLSSFIIYYKSGRNALVLIPFVPFMIISNAYVAAVVLYVAVPVLLLLAYLYRKQPLLSGGSHGNRGKHAPIGVVRAALPLRRDTQGGRQAEDGAEHACHGAGLRCDKRAFRDRVYESGIQHIPAFGSQNLPPMLCPNLEYLTSAFYPVTHSYITIVSLIAYASFLALYCLYPKSLKPLIALGPILVFFFSWRNTPEYFVPFIPLLLAAYFCNKEDKCKDSAVSRRKVALVLALVVLLAGEPDCSFRTGNTEMAAGSR